MRLTVWLGNPFGNWQDWQFCWPTNSPISYIRQYIQFGNCLLVFPYNQLAFKSLTINE